MKKISLIKLLVAASAIAATQTTLAQSRIVGGTTAQTSDYPFMAAVSYRGGEQFCGGSLIAKRWVLTAAHCLTGESAGQISVVMGRTNLTARDGEEINVARDASAEPVELVGAGSNLASPGTMATVIGWGRTSEDGNASNILRQVSVPIINHAVCNRAYNNINANLEICAGLTQGGRDSCQGDSGGPLFVSGGQGSRYRQAGVVSWGDGCARPGAPGVYARVSGVINWITQNTNGEVGGGTAGGSGSSGGDNGSGSGGNPTTPAGTLTAAFSASCQDLRCVFNAAASTEGASPIEQYVWEFGDDSWDFGSRVVRTFNRYGVHEVTLYVMDENGDQVATTKRVTLKEPSNMSGGLNTDRWTGRLADGARRVVPSRTGFYINKGPLVSILGHSKNADLDMIIQKRDESTGRWRTLRRAETDGARELVRMKNVGAGYYRYIVYSFDGASGFRVTARHR